MRTENLGLELEFKFENGTMLNYWVLQIFNIHYPLTEVDFSLLRDPLLVSTFIIVNVENQFFYFLFLHKF